MDRRAIAETAGGGRRWLLVGVGVFVGVAALVLLLAAVGRPASAATLCVRPGGGDGCEAAINDAVALAQPGDTIQVAAGVYTENVFISKTVTMQGGWNADFTLRDLDAFSATIRPADATQSVVAIEDADPTFDGFVITGGRADLGFNHGGGLRIVDSNGRVISNTIRDNGAYLLGGGVWVQRGAPTLENNRIEENASLGPGQDAYGGGVMVENGPARLVDNVIAGNVVSGTTTYGGGVAVVGNEIVVLQGNEILDNRSQAVATGYGGGVGIVSGGAFSLTANVIANNLVTGITTYGGGVGIASDEPAAMQGNSVLDNRALAVEMGIGGGVGIASGGTFSLTANEIGGNRVTTTAGLFGADVHAAGGGVGLLGDGSLQMVETVIRGNVISATSPASAYPFGGGIYALGSGTVTMSGGRVDENAALQHDDASAWGGGLFQQGGEMALHNVTVGANEAQGGAGLFLINDALLMEGSAVTGNRAEFGAGALLYYSNTNGSAVVHGSAFSSNVAVSVGGAVYQVGGSLALQESAVISNVSQQNRGGGVAAEYRMATDVLTVTRSTMAGNEAQRGGAIFSSIRVYVEGSILRGNAAGEYGGGLVTYRESTVVNSAIVGNTSDGYGAALRHIGSDPLTLQDVTVSGNEAVSAGAVVADGNVDLVNATVTENGPAGIFQDAGAVTLANTIIAANVGVNCNEEVTTMGNNLEDADTCGLALAMDDLPLTEALLGPLADNGGPTPTHAIPGDSPAVDAADNAACSAADQRGRPRVDGDMDGTITCDIGAHEFVPSLAVNSTADRVDADTGDGVCDTGEMVDGEPECTLRAAVQTANALGGVEVITVPAGLYTLTLSGANEDAAATGDLDLNVSAAVMGAGPGETIVDGGGLDRVFDLAPPALAARPGAVAEEGIPVAIEGLSVRNGEADEGGGIRNSLLIRLRLVDVVVQGNSASVFGGGLFNGGEMEMVRAAVIDNFGDDGGGMFTEGDSTTAIYSSTFSGNETAGSGGGINNQGGLWLEASTLSGNEAATNGGGLYNNARATLVNVTVSGNEADRGGGLRNGNTISLLNVTIAGNTAGDPDDGSGLENDTDATLQNVLLAGNSPANCAGGALTSLGHNLDSGDTCGFGAAGDLVNADPLLEPLADNGGPAETHALDEESAAVDAGDDEACPAADQRGVARPVDGDEDGTAGCDIGAFELLPASDLTWTLRLPVIFR